MRLGKGRRTIASSTSLASLAHPTTADWVDVQWDINGGLVWIPAASFISMELEGEAFTQDGKVRVLTKAHQNTNERELLAETDISVGAVTAALSGAIRGAFVKVQVKQGTTPGGTLNLALCLK